MLYSNTPLIIDQIVWERLLLTIFISSEQIDGIQFALLKTETKQELILEKMIETKLEANYQSNHYVIKMNLSIIGANGREFIENGQYLLSATIGGKREACFVEPELAKEFESYSRIYRYLEQYAYTVTFSGYTDDGVKLYFFMQSTFVKTNSKWKKRRYLKDKHTIASFARTAASLLMRRFMNALYFALRVFYKGKGNILMMSERHITLSGNLRAIDSKIKSLGIDRKRKISYLLTESGQIEGKLFQRIKQAVTLSKYDYIFVDDICPTFTWLKLSKEVILTQVWHSGEGFKAVGYARFGKQGTPHPYCSFHRKYTYALCGSDKMVGIFQEMFGINSEALLPFGMPRIDSFLSSEDAEKSLRRIYSVYPNFERKKIYFYCPTFRGMGQKTAYFDFSCIDWERLGDFLISEGSLMAIRMHPFVKMRLNIPDMYSDYFFDLSDYPEINDIFHVASVFITDYSSAYYEYALLGRPMIFYTFDRSIFEATRGVYQSVKESAPGKVCDTFDDLMQALENQDYEFDKVQLFLSEHFGNINVNGNASEQLLHYILK